MVLNLITFHGVVVVIMEAYKDGHDVMSKILIKKGNRVDLI